MWNKSIDGHCFVNPGQFFVGSVAAQLVIDVALMALPACTNISSSAWRIWEQPTTDANSDPAQIGRLNLPLGQKFAIGLMFMFGFVYVVSYISLT